MGCQDGRGSPTEKEGTLVCPVVGVLKDSLGIGGLLVGWGYRGGVIMCTGLADTYVF